MPVDAQGNRADVIMDGDSTIKRMNIGRMYEQHINATSRHVTNVVRGMIQNDRSPASYEQAWQYLLGYYKIVSPKFFDLITGPSYTKAPHLHVEDIVKDGVYLWMPTDNPIYMPEMIRDLIRDYNFPLGPVTYRGRSGNLVTTKKDVLIASIYVMLLEKTSTYDWSGVASAKLNPHGIAARLTQMDRHAAPGRPQPVRIAGESEVKLFVATIGGRATADLLDKSNNPRTHKRVIESVLRAPNPTDILRVVDRTETPMGGSRPLLNVYHVMECAGIGLFRPEHNQKPLPIYEE